MSTIRTLVFEDKGQDFLEWDLDRTGRVIACRPFQESVWKNTVIVRNARKGRRPVIVTRHFPGQLKRLNYRIVQVRRTA